MSEMKRAFEEENADFNLWSRCKVCGEYEDECICLDVATEGHVFYPGDETELNAALDQHLTRTPEE